MRRLTCASPLTSSLSLRPLSDTVRTRLDEVCREGGRACVCVGDGGRENERERASKGEERDSRESSQSHYDTHTITHEKESLRKSLRES